MASPAVAQGLTSFVQAFSAVDAVGSRRRREKLLDARLEDERAFRAQQIEFQQSAEDRAQTEFDETREQQERRRAGDAIGLDPSATDAQLREAAKDSAVAQRAILRRNQQTEGTSVLRGLRDQQIAARQASASQAGARAEEPEQLSGLSAGVQAAQLPSDVGAIRKFSSTEIAKQRGVSGVDLVAEAGFSADVPGDFLKLDEIKALGKTDPDRAEAIRQRQTAELIEADPRDGTAAVDAGVAKKANAEILWSDHADSSNPAGDQWRKFVRDNPSAAVSVYFDARNSLKPETRRENDSLMKPVTEKALAEQRLILDAPDADPTSQDVARARRKYSRALAVDHAIVTGFDPAREGGIRPAGIPNNASGEVLADDFRGQLQAGPRTDGSMIAENKQRQVGSQLIRDHANPTKRATDQQLKNLYIGVQMGLINPEQAVWAAWHGGQLQGALPEHILVGKDQTLIVKSGDGFRVIHSPVATDRQLNEFSAGSRAALTAHFSQYNTKDDDKRGVRYLSDFTAFLGRTRSVASKLGIDLSSEIDLVQLANRYAQAAIFSKEYNEQFWEFGPDFIGDREDYAEHFDSFDASVYGTKIDDFLAIKSGEILNEFRDIRLDPLTGGGIDAAGFRRAVKLDNPQAAAELNQRFPSDSDLEQALLQQAQLEQQGQ